MNNKELPAETAADSGTEAEVTPSSQTIANAPVGSSFQEIFTRKKSHYGCMSMAVIEFSAEEFATRKMIEENKSILEMAKLHMDSRAALVLQSRIDELERMIR